MANPNKTVAAFARKHPRIIERTDGRNSTPFSTWLIEQATAGVIFQTMEQAQAEFDKTQGAK